MADLKQALSEEIRRLARKEIRTELAPYIQALNTAKKMIAEQKKQIAALQKHLMVSPEEKKDAAESSAAPEERRVRLNAAGIVRIRTKLKITQAEMAALLGVSLHTVSMWELDRISPRKAMKAKVCALRKIGKRELAQRLEEQKQQKPVEASQE